MNFKKKYPNLLVRYIEEEYKKSKGGQIKYIVPLSDLYIYWGEIEFKDTVTDEDVIEIEEIICAEFGCRKVLNLTEKLCGKYCINHMKRQQEIFHNGLA